MDYRGCIALNINTLDSMNEDAMMLDKTKNQLIILYFKTIYLIFKNYFIIFLK